MATTKATLTSKSGMTLNISSKTDSRVLMTSVTRYSVFVTAKSRAARNELASEYRAFGLTARPEGLTELIVSQ